MVKETKYNTENKIKPLPLGRGQLLCNYLLFSVSQPRKPLVFWAPKIHKRFLRTPNKPSTLVDGKIQGVHDNQKYFYCEICNLVYKNRKYAEKCED